ncbi:unnamed protein product [Plutella xylostella]|uniref:(diamondback moth) hypothetical protein n=1 Tax=Plutella xylostella TaxID=51655 RepID=A0A8S4DIU1_PLUXY|nr:unnamed protein product [Plutella xylostella]
MSEVHNICRLCMDTKVLKNMFVENLSSKIFSCVEIQVHPDDGLPQCICVQCEQNINSFYNFKQKCSEINKKLKSSLEAQELDSKSSSDVETTIKIEYDFSNSDLKDTLESWLGGDARPFNHHYLEEELTNLEDEINSSFLDKKHTSEDNFHESKPCYEKKQNKKTKEQIVYQCELCGNIYKTRSILETHLKSHTGVKLYSCSVCPKRFTRAAHKIVHMRAHMGIKPYICEICGRSSTKRQDLIRHLRIHSDEKKYNCPTCDRKFKRSGDVHAHMRTHTGVRPFHCPNCDKCYTSQSGLRKHYKTHCNSKAFVNNLLSKAGAE